MIDPLHRTLTVTTARDAGDVALLDFGDKNRPVDIVFSHANGFNALTYRQALAPLADRLRIIAIDLRGHGRTTLPANPQGRSDWTDFEHDLIAVLDALGLSAPVVLAGHSMGGSVSLMAAARLGERVKGLVLFEPVVPERPSSPSPDQSASITALADGALRRRADYPDKEAALSAYRGRGAFRSWPDAVIADYVEDGFEGGDDGAVRLACAPAWEAANFRAQDQMLKAMLLATAQPTQVLRGVLHSTCSVKESDPAAALNRHLRIETIAGTSHFLPMERADLVQSALLEAAKG